MGWGIEYKEKLLPCGAYYPFDVKISPNYEFIYLSQIIFMINTVTVAISINTFLTAVVFHLCGQLQVIALNVKYTTTTNNIYHFVSLIPQECKCLHCIVKRHLRLVG